MDPAEAGGRTPTDGEAPHEPAAPADAAPEDDDWLAEAVEGRLSVIFDSGVRNGLDICRAMARGANFVLLGRAFIFAVAALGKRGGDHLMDILMADLVANLANLGCRSVDDLPRFLAEP